MIGLLSANTWSSIWNDRGRIFLLNAWVKRACSIATFAMPGVFFHPRPPILLVEASYFHPHGTLLEWQCIMIGIEFLKARWLLRHKPEYKELGVLESYMMSDTPKGPPLIFHASIHYKENAFGRRFFVIWAAKWKSWSYFTDWAAFYDSTPNPLIWAAKYHFDA